MTHVRAERWRMRRLEGVEHHHIIATRIRPGYLARVVDVSAGGVLVETKYRLLPGAVVELQMQTDTRNAKMRGEVLRSAVAKVHHDAVCYRGAIRFDRHLPWFVDESGDTSSSESRPAHPQRASAAPEVI